MKYLVLIFLIYLSNYVIAQSRRHSTSNYNGTSSTTSSNYNRGDGTMTMVERIYDRVLGLVTLDEQELKKLEALDYKLTRIEVSNQERMETMKNELREINRRTQNLDWLTSKTEGTLEQLRSELEAIRQNLDTNGLRVASVQSQATAAPTVDVDCSEKLTALATLLTSTRAAVHKLEKTMDTLGVNITQLLLSTRDIRQHQHTTPTKQYLNSALHGLRSQTPVYALIPPSDSSNTYSNSPTIPPSCTHMAVIKSGIYKIQVSTVKESFFVMCDGETDEGGWTVIQNRIDGSVNFNRNWLEYKFGFGNVAGEFFIGLDKLHDMTATMLHELLIVMVDFEGVRKTAKYQYFGIAGEKEDYALNLLGKYEGDAGDALSYSASYKFSTFDNDNDGWVEGNCAQSHTGAWWYNACEMANLNGQYFGGEVPAEHQFQGMYWNDFRGSKYSLQSVKMMIRPVDRIFSPE